MQENLLRDARQKESNQGDAFFSSVDDSLYVLYTCPRVIYDKLKYVYVYSVHIGIRSAH